MCVDEKLELKMQRKKKKKKASSRGEYQQVIACRFESWPEGSRAGGYKVRLRQAETRGQSEGSEQDQARSSALSSAVAIV